MMIECKYSPGYDDGILNGKLFKKGELYECDIIKQEPKIVYVYSGTFNQILYGEYFHKYFYTIAEKRKLKLNNINKC